MWKRIVKIGDRKGKHFLSKLDDLARRTPRQNADLSKISREERYLRKYVFRDLMGIYYWIENPGEWYFSECEFETVLERVKELGIGIYGIEPWQNGYFFDCKVFEDYKTTPTDPGWYMTAFEEFKNTREVLEYGASYHIPEELLKEFPFYEGEEEEIRIRMEWRNQPINKSEIKSKEK